MNTICQRVYRKNTGYSRCKPRRNIMTATTARNPVGASQRKCQKGEWAYITTTGRNYNSLCRTRQSLLCDEISAAPPYFILRACTPCPCRWAFHRQRTESWVLPWLAVSLRQQDGALFSRLETPFTEVRTVVLCSQKVWCGLRHDLPFRFPKVEQK